MPSSIVRFRPAGPWRFGPDTGARDRIDLIYHSDSLYAAVTNAMLRLGMLNEWLDATVRRQDGEPEVRFSSMFPFQRNLLFVTPPCSLWPPPPSTKIRYKSARFVPMAVVQSLVSEQNIDENRWIIDGESQCMIPSGEGPFRIGLRAGAAVDRISRAAIDTHATACLEFSRDAGLWTTVVFSSDEAQDRWRPRVKSALRLLADSGFGGERSRGWGRSSDPEWSGSKDLLNWSGAPDTPTAYWLLSLYAPTEGDGVDRKTGNYNTVTRTGRVENAANWGALKTPTLMIGEGSVLMAARPLRGEARDVSPAESAHPVYRAGFAVALPIPWRAHKPHTVVEPTAVPKPVRESAPVEPVYAAPEEQPAPAVLSEAEAPPVSPEAPRETQLLLAAPEPQLLFGEPAALPPEPQTEALTADAEPAPLAPDAAPEHLSAEAEPQPLAPDAESRLAPEAEPETLAPESEPQRLPETEPEQLSAEPEPAGLSPEAEPQTLAPESEPQPLAPEAEPEHLSAEPEPAGLSPDAEPRPLAPEAEPQHLAPESEAQPLAPDAEPEHVSGEPLPAALSPQAEPHALAPESEPQPLAPEAEPEHLSAEREAAGLSPEAEPQALAPESEPQPLAPQPEPEQLSPQQEPSALSPEAEPQPLAPPPAHEPEAEQNPEPENHGEPPTPEPDTHGGEQ